MFFIAYAFKGQVNVFAGRVKTVSHSSSRTSSILKYFVPCDITVNYHTHKLMPCQAIFKLFV